MIAACTQKSDNNVLLFWWSSNLTFDHSQDHSNVATLTNRTFHSANYIHIYIYFYELNQIKLFHKKFKCEYFSNLININYS